MTDVEHPVHEVAAPRSPLGMRVFVVVAVVVVIFGVIFSSRFGVDPSLVESPLIGTQMREVTVPLLESDGAVALHEGRGDILVINFWASWCLPCRSEHPALVATAAEFAAVDVRFVGVLSQVRTHGAPASNFSTSSDVASPSPTPGTTAPGPHSPSARSGSPRRSSSIGMVSSPPRSPVP